MINRPGLAHLIKTFVVQKYLLLAAVVVQTVECSLPISEIRGLNPFIGKFYFLSTVMLKICIEKT